MKLLSMTAMKLPVSAKVDRSCEEVFRIAENLWDLQMIQRGKQVENGLLMLIVIYV